MRWLVISDLQIPFEAPKALDFVESVRREFRIPKSNILCVGDEVDHYFGSQYQKYVDGSYTAGQEIEISKEKLKAWYAAFPQMRLANSNHGQRWAKRAVEAEIPAQMLRAYQEVLAAPSGWRWADSWRIDDKHPFKMIHGMGYGGMYAFRHAPMDQGISTVFGHLHANAGISHIVTASQRIWGLNVGCLIDVNAYAFHYGKDNRFKPWLGVGVVIDDGRTPILIPYDRSNANDLPAAGAVSETDSSAAEMVAGSVERPADNLPGER